MNDIQQHTYIPADQWKKIHSYEHGNLLIEVWQLGHMQRVRVRSTDGGRVFSHGTETLHDVNCFVDVEAATITITKDGE